MTEAIAEMSLVLTSLSGFSSEAKNVRQSCNNGHALVFTPLRFAITCSLRLTVVGELTNAAG